MSVMEGKSKAKKKIYIDYNLIWEKRNCPKLTQQVKSMSLTALRFPSHLEESLLLFETGLHSPRLSSTSI